MACSSADILVFTETNLGTRIAVPISPDASPIEFKKEFERAHLNCFREHGKIRVKSTMVKKNSCFYHLSESLLLKHVFQGSQGSWFLYIEACPCGINDQPVQSECVAPEVVERVSDGNGGSDVTDSAQPKKSNTKGNKKMRRMKGVLFLRNALLKFSIVSKISKRKKKKRKQLKGHRTINCSKIGFEHANKRLDPLPSNDEDKLGKGPSESPCETFTESVSVSGLINKYFSYNDEVTSGCSRAVDKHKVQFRGRMTTPSTPLSKMPGEMLHLPLLDELSSKFSREKKPEVGKRLMVASGNLSLSLRKQDSKLSICKYRDEMSMTTKSTTCVRSLVYEISDEDD